MRAYAAKRDEFFLKVVEARISFERDAAGKVTRLVLHQNGRDMPGDRAAGDAGTAVTLDAATLAGYAGEYALTPEFAITVSVKDGRLFATATGQQGAEIFASKKDEFFYRVVDAQISFQRDGAGKVTGLVLHQNGRDLPATRK